MGIHAAPTLTGLNSKAVAEELGHGLLSCRRVRARLSGPGHAAGWPLLEDEAGSPVVAMWPPPKRRPALTGRSELYAGQKANSFGSVIA